MCIRDRFNCSLNKASDPVLAALADIRGQTMATVRRGGVTATAAAVKIDPGFAAASQRIRAFLEPQVQQGLVKVIEEPQQTTIRIRGDGLFESGKAEVKATLQGLLQQIGAEFAKVQGRVLVTGHSDNVPIRTLQFPSNGHLSKARADSVVQILASAGNNPNRFISEGRADTQPVVANDNPQNRALNRRVDIVLLARVN